MVTIDQSLLKGKIRDRPISKELELVLTRAGNAAGIDKIFVTSGGQPGTAGKSTGSTRHNGGRAADLRLVAGGKRLTFSDSAADPLVARFVTAAAAHGASGIGAGVNYMGAETLHVGFGRTISDAQKLVWGAGGHAKNAPQWLRDAAKEGWFNPPAWVFDDDDSPEDLPEDRDDVIRAEDDDEIAEVVVKPLVLDDIPARFSREVILAAQATQRRWRTPASVTLAQWALESAYGKSMPAGSNNPFGIKALRGQPTVMASTIEFIGGKKVRKSEPFRAFASLDEAFIQHGELLGTSRHYVEARKFTSDPDRFADALTGIYATDPQYGAKLRSIMSKNDLYRFDIDVDGDGSADVEIIGRGTDVMTEALRRGDARKTRVIALQKRLVDLGYKLGEIDGKFGSLTETAVLAFQSDNGLASTGFVDERTEAALDVAEPRRLDEKRLRTTETDLAESGSRIVVNARRSRLLSWITAALGALGVGNSAVINAGGGQAGAAVGTPGVMPEGLLPFLADVQKLAPGAPPAELTRLADAAKGLSAKIGALSPPPEIVAWLGQVRKTISPEVLAKYPDISTVLDSLARAPTQQSGGMRTIFDVLPGLFAPGGNLQAIMEGVAGIGASVLPGFGGSAAILAAALASRLFANNIATARVEDHQNGNTISPLKP